MSVVFIVSIILLYIGFNWLILHTLRIKPGSYIRLSGLEGRVTAINVMWIDIEYRNTTYSVPVSFLIDSIVEDV